MESRKIETEKMNLEKNKTEFGKNSKLQLPQHPPAPPPP